MTRKNLSSDDAGTTSRYRQVLAEIVISGAVFEEITIPGKRKPGAMEVQTATWIKRRSPQDRTVIGRLSRRLNVGEVEALALTTEMRAALLIRESLQDTEKTRCAGTWNARREKRVPARNAAKSDAAVRLTWNIASHVKQEEHTKR